MLDQILVDMRNQLAQAKQQVASSIADEKRLGPGGRRAGQAQDWEKAMLAVKQGRDDLAKQALLRHTESLQHANQLERPGRCSRRRSRSSRTRCATSTTRSKKPSARRTCCSPASAGAGAAAHRGDDVVDVGEVGVRGVRADGRANREERTADQGVRGDRRRVHGRSVSARTSRSSRSAAVAGHVDDRLLQLKQKMGMLGGRKRGRPGEATGCWRRRGGKCAGRCDGTSRGERAGEAEFDGGVAAAFRMMGSRPRTSRRSRTGQSSASGARE